MEISEKIETYIKKHIPTECDKLLIAISGGADSVALFRALKNAGISIVAAHCNFHLRGDESDRDEKFVKELCLKSGIECHVAHFDVHRRCEATGESIEMACRELRYEWFRKLMEESKCNRIAVAHNSDDNIETMLLNFFRGTGISGLCGMKHDTGEILRPMLDISRHEILEYLKTLNQPYVTDSTNLQSDFKRNYIRNELLPQLEQRWPGIRKALRRTQKNISGAEKLYSAKVSETIGNHKNILPLENLWQSPDTRSIVFEFLKPYGVTEEITDEITGILISIQNDHKPHKNRKWHTPSHTISLERDCIEAYANTPDGGITWHITEELVHPDAGTPSMIKSNRDQNVAFLPYPLSHYTLRPTSPGDRIAPLGVAGTTSVSKIMKDAKLSSLKKKQSVVLEEKNTGTIVWIPGLKRSRHHLVTGTEKAIYKFTLASKEK